MLLITRVSLKEDESMGNEVLDSVNLMGVFCLVRGVTEFLLTSTVQRFCCSALWSPTAWEGRESPCPEEKFVRKYIFCPALGSQVRGSMGRSLAAMLK